MGVNVDPDLVLPASTGAYPTSADPVEHTQSGHLNTEGTGDFAPPPVVTEVAVVGMQPDDNVVATVNYPTQTVEPAVSMPLGGVAPTKEDMTVTVGQPETKVIAPPAKPKPVTQTQAATKVPAKASPGKPPAKTTRPRRS